MSLNIEKDIEVNKKKEIDKILELYLITYPEYKKMKNKIKFYDLENRARTDIDLDETTINNEHIGYLIKEKLLKLNDNLIKFMFIRYNGLQNCICKFESNNIKDPYIIKYIHFLKNELQKLKVLISEYQKKFKNINSDIEEKIIFIKKLCEAILWGFEDNNSSCRIFDEKKRDLHSKTFKPNKQLVLGSRDGTDWKIYRHCNNFFWGKKIYDKFNNPCDKTVEFSMILNKYSTLSAYYKKAPFIRFLLIDGLIMPHRRFPPILDIKGVKIGIIEFGPFIFNIYLEDEKIQLYDENNFLIKPPLLRSSITYTYTEFRDLLCYLNLPVFRSTVNRNMLFFPNYDLHQRLLEIQGLPRNYGTYTGQSIDWKWFKEGETVAKEAIKCFCEEYEEGPGYGLVPVEYVWYDIEYPDTQNIKKFIFLVVPFEELDYYTGSDIYKRDGKYYVCNKDEVPEHMVPELKRQKSLDHVDYIWYDIYLFLVIPLAEAIKYGEKITAFTNKEKKNYYCTKPYPQDIVPWVGLTKVKQKSLKSFREKYLKYKIKYLNLKKLLQKI